MRFNTEKLKALIKDNKKQGIPAYRTALDMGVSVFAFINVKHGSVKWPTLRVMYAIMDYYKDYDIRNWIRED
jgi:hypothetical protein